jgi:predicted Fe-Mo cluster-binding NifX family protein
LILPDGETDRASGREMVLVDMSNFERLRILRERHVGTLICGALSPDLLSYGENLGLRIIHGVAGDLDEVLHAYHNQELDQPHFRLPGYREQGSQTEG